MEIDAQGNPLTGLVPSRRFGRLAESRPANTGPTDGRVPLSRQALQSAQRALSTAQVFIEAHDEFSTFVRAELGGPGRPRLRLISTGRPATLREVAPEAWLELDDTSRTDILRMLTGRISGRSKHR